MLVASPLGVKRAVLLPALAILLARTAYADPQRPGIIATLGPSTHEVATVRAMIRAGMDVARINLSHGNARQTAAKVQTLRAAARAEGREIPLEFDLPGGKVRTGPGTAQLRVGDLFELHLGVRGVTTSRGTSVTYRDLARHAAPHDRVVLDDRLLELEVERVEPGRIITRVVRGGTLQPRKGLAVVGRELSFPPLISRDRRKLDVALANGASWIGASMVQSAKNLQALRRALEGRGTPQLVAKIESMSALANLDEILAASDSVMIARGDLTQAVSAGAMPGVQSHIAAVARAKGKPFIMATNFLSAMISGAPPSADNLADIARALAEGPSHFMLNETAIAPAPAEVVRRMAEALGRERAVR